MKKVLLISSFFFTILGNAQTASKMDTIYKQKLNELILTFVRTSDDSKVEWKTILKNKSGKEIILHSDSLVKDMGWKYKESVSESPINLYNISSSYLENSNLYIIYNRFGEISLNKFTFLVGDKFDKEEKILDKYLVSGGFGNMVNQCEIKEISGDLYFTLSTGQTGTGAKDDFYKFNLLDFIPKSISFSNYSKKIKTFRISEFGKKKYEQYKSVIDNYNRMSPQEKKSNVAPTKDEIDANNFTAKYLNNAFNYLYIKDENELKKLEEITDIENYPLFLKVYGDKGYSDEVRIIDENKIRNAEQYIKEAIIISGNYQKGEQITLLDYIYDSGQKNRIYFFYRHKLGVNIIIFDNYDSEWLLGNYKEQDIKQE